MKLTDRISALRPDTPFYTFEFFPPKTDQGFSNLVSRIGRMSALRPIAVSITWSAGGSTKDRSLQLAGLCQVEQNEQRVDTILHLTCTNMQIGMVDDALRSAKEKGIQNILALRGDPPRGEEYWIPADPRFTHAVDLVRYIKTSDEFKDYFCVGVAAYPDGHTETSEDEDQQIKYLKEKVDAGADFIVTQLFYDVDGFLRWKRNVLAAGITIPIIPGIMPLQSYASFMRLTTLCGTRIPSRLTDALNPIKHDDQQVKDLGVDVAVSMIRRLHQSGVHGFHFCTLNLEKSVQRVLDRLGWAGPAQTNHNQLISGSPILAAARPGSIPSNLFVTPAEASFTASASFDKNQHNANLPIGSSHQAGKGALNNYTTWDEFPNGRFGDSKSPAFGQTDLWDSGLGVSPNDGIKRWGRPKTPGDVTSVFLAYLEGRVQSTPWSGKPLDRESASILPHLKRLTERSWWTVGSQPEADAKPSSDEIYGWGPRGGYVFQKAFVEFFVTKDEVQRLEEKIAKHGRGQLTYFAANMLDDYASNMAEGGSNVVTWGVFPGQEIAASTIIERDSFLAWKDEAFGFWTEWSLFYPPDSPERANLERLRDERWLISIVHHDYKSAEALWMFLFSD